MVFGPETCPDLRLYSLTLHRPCRHSIVGKPTFVLGFGCVRKVTSCCVGLETPYRIYRGHRVHTSSLLVGSSYLSLT